MNETWHFAAVLLQTVTALSRSQLRWEFANTAAAVALLAIALAAIALFIFRRRTGDKTLIYFGLFCILYAARLLSLLPSFRALFNESGEFWHYDDWIITCTIILPLGLFLYQLVYLRFKNLVRWLLIAQTIFGIFGIVAAAMGVRLNKLFAANNVMVLVVTIVPALFMIIDRLRSGTGKRLPHEGRVLIGGLSIWLLFVIRTNLVGLGIFSGHNVEFIGFLFFVASLGYVAAYRTFANEEQLVAINKELEIARQIQSSTLPQSVPVLPGLEIAVRYAPMSAVAGDFYDFISVDAKHVGILVADVTGHGVPAALIASMLKVAFTGQAEHASDPARVMTGLNQVLCGKFEEHFVTAAYLFVDLERRVLRYSAAAHPPLLMGSRTTGDAKEIEENGLMLGMIPEAAYTSVEIPIRAADRCLLYTDGLFEAHNAAQQEYGKTRCKEFLSAHRDLDATEFASALLVDIAKFSGQDSAGAQEDDITLVVLDIR
jgi:sigma-B regulation protein RsbU (phosphoserine phosphatase)